MTAMTQAQDREGTLRTVGQVADQFGVTVRTLHHYDAIGLLSPSARSHSGYRLYTPADLARLQNVVVYRRLGFPLEQVAELLAADADVADHLRRQRDAVLTRLDELSRLVVAIDRALEREMSNEPATHEEIKELFGDGFTDEYAAEAEERWGDTDAWAQSRARTSRYTKADWEDVKAEQEASGRAFVAALEAGEPADGPVAMDAAEQARVLIDRRFYDCPPDFHRGLADMYLADPRFRATYEAMAPGLAQYVHDAIHANADRKQAT